MKEGWLTKYDVGRKTLEVISLTYPLGFTNHFRRLYIYIFIIFSYYLNILIGQEIVTWSSLETRIDFKNHVLTWINTY
jgi:hypothetical protein